MGSKNWRHISWFRLSPNKGKIPWKSIKHIFLIKWHYCWKVQGYIWPRQSVHGFTRKEKKRWVYQIKQKRFAKWWIELWYRHQRIRSLGLEQNKVYQMGCSQELRTKIWRSLSQRKLSNRQVRLSFQLNKYLSWLQTTSSFGASRRFLHGNYLIAAFRNKQWKELNRSRTLRPEMDLSNRSKRVTMNISMMPWQIDSSHK